MNGRDLTVLVKTNTLREGFTFQEYSVNGNGTMELLNPQCNIKHYNVMLNVTLLG